MADSRTHDIFISYSSRDEPWASEFVNALRAEGVNVWFDRAQIAPGDRWKESIEQALRESRIVVALLSPDYLNSSYSFFQLGAALADNKTIIPILTKDVERARLPSLLRDRQWLEESSPQLAGKRVAEVVSQMHHRAAEA